MYTYPTRGQLLEQANYYLLIKFVIYIFINKMKKMDFQKNMRKLNFSKKVYGFGQME